MRKDRKENASLEAAEVKEHGLIRVLNKYSLLFHIILACGVCFLIEWISRHSFVEACYFVVDRNLVFLYNSLIVYSSLMLVYIVRRRAVLRTIICAFWLFLGVINGCILAKRVSPFSFTDLKMISDLFMLESNYFTKTEAALVIAGVGVCVLLLVVFWIKGPKFAGRQHRMMGLVMIFAVVMMLPNVTNAAVSNHILTSYFENLAQGYKDYGFVYSFSASVLDRGMSAPEEYSEEAVRAVLQKVQNAEAQAGTATAQSTAEQDSTATAQSTKAQADTATARNTETQADTATAQNMETQADTATAQSVGAQDAVLVQEKAVRTASQNGDGTPPAQAETSGETETTESFEVPGETEGEDQEYPNIICVLLESFIDPETVRFLHTSEDAIPNFRRLSEQYSSGYLEVPVVGAGTANTEFEILTGMGMQFFGLGEYPYKTILKQTNCESIASDLRTLGYGAHAVHNNGGNFYSRANAFSMMGFNSFTCKEMMNIQDYTPLGTWPTDDILIGEVEKSLDHTPNRPDFVYTITVESHGDYPKKKVIDDPAIEVTGPEDEGERYAWEYYVNQIHEVDDFIGDLIEMLSQRDEKTIVVMFGDHLPTMGLTEEDMTTNSLFLTKYATWNNFGLEKTDKNMTSYQLLADITDELGIHTGTMFTYHQNRNSMGSEEEYQEGMELLQYDILYGEHYVYDGGNPYPATPLEMGTQDVLITDAGETGLYFYVHGKNFTRWSRIYLDGEKIKPTFLSSEVLRISADRLDEGLHTVVVSQVGSSDTIFRSSTPFYYRKEAEPETENP